MLPQKETQHKKGTEYLIPRVYDPDDWKDAILDQRVYSYDDYAKLPEGAPYQLIGGKLVMTPAPGVYHQKVSRNLGFQLHTHVSKNKLGEVFYAPIDVQLDDHNVYQPDIIFIHHDHNHIIGTQNITGSPDLVIEILSPSTAYYDLREKFEIYENSGVREYWIVDPKQRKIEVFLSTDGHFVLNNQAREIGSVSSGILEGFSISLDLVF